MICFPNGKINIGLNVLSKRPDGFHNIESVFYPVPILDALEIIPANSMQLTVSGFVIPGLLKENLVLKAYKEVTKVYKLPPLKIHLHKGIPIGSGLGGGSADAPFFIRTINEYFTLGREMEEMLLFAGKLGSDCPFFIRNEAVLVTGRGENHRNTNLSLADKYLVIIKPKVDVSTPAAYELVQAGISKISLPEIISKPVEQWKGLLVNDFEIPICEANAQIAEIKKELYKLGAVYAAMSGSGSAVYGIFINKPNLHGIDPNYYLWVAKL